MAVRLLEQVKVAVKCVSNRITASFDKHVHSMKLLKELRRDECLGLVIDGVENNGFRIDK